jgi:anti-sigma B factor antagonist
VIQFDLQQRDGAAVVGVRGRLDMVAAPQLRAIVDEQVAAGTSRFVVDFGPTEFIDSSGLGAVVGALKAARLAGGDLRICGVAGQVELILQLTNLDRVFRSYPTVEAAIDAVGSAG